MLSDEHMRTVARLEAAIAHATAVGSHLVLLRDDLGLVTVSAKTEDQYGSTLYFTGTGRSLGEAVADFVKVARPWAELVLEEKKARAYEAANEANRQRVILDAFEKE